MPIDMTSDAVDKRLKHLGKLYKLCKSLMKAGKTLEDSNKISEKKEELNYEKE